MKLFSFSSFLDYGCGNGDALYKVKRKYKHLEVFGVDISDFVIEKNKELFSSCNFFTVDKFLPNDIEIDSILSSHTFEHVDNPVALARLLLARSKENLIIIVPDRDSWIECEQHIWRFDKKSFNELRPTFKIRGLINRAGNAELLFFWSKKRKKINFLIPIIVFVFLKIFRNNYIGIAKRILKVLKIKK